MKFILTLIFLIVLGLAISGKVSRKVKVVPPVEELSGKCFGDKTTIINTLTNAGQRFLLKDWEGDRDRKSSYAQICGCPGITAYSDNKRLPFKYMQCCLRNLNDCPSGQHQGIHEVIKLASEELNSKDKKSCNGAPTWADKGNLASDGFLYRGQEGFFGAEMTKLTQIGAVWQYLAFTSLSYDKERAAGYSNDAGKKKGTYMLRIKGNALLRGKFVEKCSLYPLEKEFLVDKNSCFKVTAYKDEMKFNWAYESLKGNDWSFKFIELEPVDCANQKIIYSA